MLPKNTFHKLFVISIAIMGNFPFSAEADDSINTIPPLDLKISAQKVAASKEDNAFYMFSLHCALGRCSLEMLEVNKCVSSGNNETSFIPIVQEWATWSGSLSVSSVKNNELSVIVYQASHQGLPAKFKIIYSTSPSDPRNDQKVIAFEGSGIADVHKFPDKIELFSVSAIKGSHSLASLDCPIQLKGIPNE